MKSTKVRIIEEEDQVQKVAHQYGNFYKDTQGSLFQLIRLDETQNGTQINLLSHPESETILNSHIMVEDSANITEKEFGILSEMFGDRLELVENVKIIIN